MHALTCQAIKTFGEFCLNSKLPVSRSKITVRQYMINIQTKTDQKWENKPSKVSSVRAYRSLPPSSIHFLMKGTLTAALNTVCYGCQWHRVKLGVKMRRTRFQTGTHQHTLLLVVCYHSWGWGGLLYSTNIPTGSSFVFLSIKTEI